MNHFIYWSRFVTPPPPSFGMLFSNFYLSFVLFAPLSTSLFVAMSFHSYASYGLYFGYFGWNAQFMTAEKVSSSVKSMTWERYDIAGSSQEATIWNNLNCILWYTMKIFLLGIIRVNVLLKLKMHFDLIRVNVAIY